MRGGGESSRSLLKGSTPWWCHSTAWQSSCSVIGTSVEVRLFLFFNTDQTPHHANSNSNKVILTKLTSEKIWPRYAVIVPLMILKCFFISVRCHHCRVEHVEKNPSSKLQAQREGHDCISRAWMSWRRHRKCHCKWKNNLRRRLHQYQYSALFPNAYF